MGSLILTVIGPDRPGVVGTLAELVANHGGSWEESRLSHLAGMFAGVVRVRVHDDKIEALLASLEKLESEGLRVRAETTGATEGEVVGPRVRLELTGSDRIGIVLQISQVLTRLSVNFEELETDRRDAPMAGQTLFHALAWLTLPRTLEPERLRDELEGVADDLIVEIHVED